MSGRKANRLMNYWMRLGHFLGDVQARILLALLFYFVITPMGLLWRLIGKDPMRSKWSGEMKDSYFLEPESQEPNHWQRMF